MEQLFSDFVRGFASAPRDAAAPRDAPNCSAALYDALFLLFGVTPENKALEMLSVTKHFNRQELSGSAQALREIVWLRDNYYKNGSGFDDTRRHLDELLKENLPKHEIRRFFSDVQPITDVLGDFSGRGRMERSPPPYLDLESPFGLLLNPPSSSQEAPATVPVPRLGSWFVSNGCLDSKGMILHGRLRNMSKNIEIIS